MKILIGNIFESKQQTLVNTVNCVGVMGKGIALEFKNKYPRMYKEYVALCHSGEIKPGKPYYYSDILGTSILNFPTKDDWKSPSKLSYIIDGLNWFRKNYVDLEITSIAFPPLGCGNGGLTWEVVGPVMYSLLFDLPIDIEIYAPFGTSPEQLSIDYLKKNIKSNPTDIIGNKSMKFNRNWLLILYIVQKLNRDKYSLSVGRTIFQKICYILTRTGVQTGFNFVEGTYGPYAKEVSDAITVLSNANLMKERRLGQMVETVVPESFNLDTSLVSIEDIRRADKTFDLLSRIQSTSQAEMIATVLFSYDELTSSPVTEQAVFDHVLKWKPRWKSEKEPEIKETIISLSALGWMKPTRDYGTLIDDID